nr:phosphotransferase [Sporolactobacillus kofuensis]
MRDIPGSDQWMNIEEIHAGWSHDQKYVVQLHNRRKYLLRLSSSDQYPRRMKEYDVVKKLLPLDINISKPVSFGRCDNNRKVFTLMTWVDGESASHILPSLSPEKQYELGYQAGKILKQIHLVQVSKGHTSWHDFYNDKIDRKLLSYKDCGIRVPDADMIIDFINVNRSLVKDRPQTFQHGDYHCGNMVIKEKQRIGIIDFDRLDIGDPWEEFNRITWCAGISEAFATGRINGYFENNVPAEFFPLMALYLATNLISSVPWSIAYGQHEIEVMTKEIEKTMEAFANFTSVIPKWYRKEF